jgi:hypothetical protein
VARGSGGAVRVIGYVESRLGTTADVERLQVVIDSCIFVSNIAHQHNNPNMDAVRASGSGGALFVFATPPSLFKLDGLVSIKQTNFTNNTAEMEGGSLFINSDMNLEVKDVYLQNSMSGTRAKIGDAMYIAGTATLFNMKIQLVSAGIDTIVLFYQAGDLRLNSLQVTDLNLICPRGYIANQMITTSGSTPAAIHSLQIYCKRCPPNQYSIEESRLRLTGITTDIVPRNHSCHRCPYGATCDDGIKNRKNFWGINVSASEVEMFSCPEGYCELDATKSFSFSTCAAHRSGPLCGRCESGYSESLLGTACVDESHCQNSNWLLLIFIFIYGLFYLLFFMFEHDWSCILNYIARHLSRHRRSKPSQADSTNFGYFQIFMYFIQTTSLLSFTRLLERDALYTSIKRPFEILPQFLIDGIQKLLEFDFPLLQRNTCFFPDLTPTGKIIAKIVFFIYLYVLLIVLYVISGCCCICVRQSQRPKCGGIR